MAPPKAGDITRAANDLFSDDFGGAENKLTLKSTAANGVALKVEGARSNASGAVNALLETKYTHKPTGVSIKEKWTTKNVVATEIGVANKVVAGSDATLCANFVPNAGIQDLKLKTALKKDAFTATMDVTQKAINASTCFGYKNFLFGVSSNISLGTFAPSGTKFTVGYREGDLIVGTSITDAAKVDGSIFHAVNPAVQAGVQFGWNRTSGATSLAVAAQKRLDATSFAKVKINTAMDINASYVVAVRPGVLLRLSADIAGNALASDKHQVGLHLTLSQ